MEFLCDERGCACAGRCGESTERVGDLLSGLRWLQCMKQCINQCMNESVDGCLKLDLMNVITDASRSVIGADLRCIHGACSHERTSVAAVVDVRLA